MAIHLLNSIDAGEKGPPPARPYRRTCSPKAVSLGSQEGCEEGIRVKGMCVGKRRVGGEREGRKEGGSRRMNRRRNLINTAECSNLS